MAERVGGAQRAALSLPQNCLGPCINYLNVSPGNEDAATAVATQ